MKIDELLDKYFEGETSCEEERELRRFLPKRKCRSTCKRTARYSLI